MSHKISKNNSQPFMKIPKVRTRPWYPFERIADDIQRGFEEQGDIIQLQGFLFRVFCLRDPDMIEKVFRDPKVAISKCPRMLPRLKSMMPNSVVVQPGGTKWREGRERMQAIFENEFMQRYTEYTQDLVSEMLETRWRQYAESNCEFDVYHEFQLVLTRLAFLILFSKKVSDPLLHDLQPKCFFMETQFPNRLPPILFNRRDKTYRGNMRELRKIMSDLVQERRENSSTNCDLLSVLLDAKQKSGGLFSDAWIIDHMIEMFNSIRLINPPLGLGLRLICQHPDVQQRLIAEAQTVCKGQAPAAELLSKQAFLQMVLSETFRFYPSALGLPRWCADGLTIDRYQIPKRSIVIPMIYHTHRNPTVFHEPEKFIPERWDTDAGQKVHPFAQLAFGAGKRTCIGIQLAMRVMRISMTMIFQRYRLTYNSQDDATRTQLSVHPKAPIKIRIEALNDSSSKLQAGINLSAANYETPSDDTANLS